MAFLVFFFAARFISCHPAWKFFFDHFPVTFLEFPKRATNVNKAMSPTLRQRLHALYQIAFALAGKLYRTGLLFTHKNAIRRDFCDGARNADRSNSKWRVTYRIGVQSGALARAKHAQPSTMSKKIRLPMHPRNYGSHMTIRPLARPPIRPQHRHANVK